MKTLKCRDVGFDCNAEIHANSEKEILEQAKKHAHDVHHVDVTPDMADEIKTKIKDE